MELPRIGIWFHTDCLTAHDAARLVRAVERLGFGVYWFGEGFGRDPFAHAAFLLAQTSRIIVATGIASIYSRDAQAMSGCANTLAEQSGGRFVLGVGVSMPALVEPRGHQFGPPAATMRAYVEAYRRSHYTAVPPAEPPPLVLAALGPRMIELAAQVAHGAHPCNVTPQFTAHARALMGAGPWLTIQQKFVFETTPGKARAIARAGMALYLAVPHQRQHFLRMGFDESDFNDGGSDRLIDALVAWGGADAICERVQAHFDAGATHVCLEPILPDGVRVPDDAMLASLAERLLPARN